MTVQRWDRALVAAPTTEARLPEVVALPPGLPGIDELFDFMRDAELRFTTLRMRIEERLWATRGEQVVVSEVMLRHPGQARVATFEPGAGTAGNHELWISDGATVRTYVGRDKRGTERPIRNRPRGLVDKDFPGTSKVYEPLTPLPTETLPELFVHPAGYCQNVLATGRCWVSGTDVVAGREAITLVCEHPRSVEWVADRQDYRIEIAVDRAEGLITRLVESVDGEVTRLAKVVALDVDAPLPPDAFEFEFPPGTSILF
ncbi:MAG TPA: hypothetical protein VFC71_04245 [Candidatus Polarisedimenticolia bacterium]|nr:hypothetical protein [Candidatus Polarisedimenticolia bacterium]